MQAMRLFWSGSRWAERAAGSESYARWPPCCFKLKKDLVRRGLEAIQRAADEDKVGSGVEQGMGHIFAEPGTRAGDKRGMALKRKELRLKGGACFRIALTIHESLRPRSVFVFWTRCCLTRRRVSKPLFDVDHPFGHSPVDDEVVPVDEIVFLVGKEQAGVDDVAGDTHTPGRMLGMIRVGKRFIAVDLYPAGAYGVDRDRRGAQGDGQRVCEGDKPPF